MKLVLPKWKKHCFLTIKNTLIMLVVLQNSKRTPGIIVMYFLDLEIMSNVYNPNLTIKVISTSNICRFLTSTSIQRQTYIE